MSQEVIDINEDRYVVYMHRFPNKKAYIGITRQDPIVRWGKNGVGYKGQFIYRAIQEYGWDKVEHFILFNNLSQEDAINVEIDLIDFFDTIRNGYNVDAGGGIGKDKLPDKIYVYNGKEYTAEELLLISPNKDLSKKDLETRINSHGWSIDDAISKVAHRRGQIFEYNGKMYSAKELLEFSQVENLTTENILCRVHNHGWSVERALTQPKNVKHEPLGNTGYEYEYQGKTYKSYELAEMSPIEGITAQQISNRINHHGWSVEKAINTPLKKVNQKYLWKGEYYTSKELAEISPVDNITFHDITDRIRSGWSMDDVMTKPKDCKHAPSKRKK